jgi:electron transfer flavoprotein alpha subunit
LSSLITYHLSPITYHFLLITEVYMSNGILVFAEHRAGVLNKTSFEAIAAAQSLGAELGQAVTAVLLGSNAAHLADEIAAYDLSGVVYADNEKLTDYTPDGYTDAMERVVRARDPQYVILPHTYLVRDFAPKLAAPRKAASRFQGASFWAR